MIILGVSGGFSYRLLDMAAAIIVDGRIVAACEEERFSRVKHSPHKIPISSMKYVLEEAGISLADVDILAYNNNTYINFERDLKEHLMYKFGQLPKRFAPVNHHLAHAASAYFGSGYDDAAIITYDYSGDGVCTGLYHGRKGEIRELETIQSKTENSLGKFYGVFTQYLGFKQLSDEYKVMGMSAYGDRNNTFDLSHIISVTDTGYEINPAIYTHTERTSLDQVFFNEDFISKNLMPMRRERDPITADHKKLAISVQIAFEQATLALAKRLRRETGSEKICLAGGCALNCVANGILHQTKLFKEIYVPSVASDAGGAIGAAYWAGVQEGEKVEPLTTAYLGPEYDSQEIARQLDLIKVDYQEISQPTEDAAREIGRGSLVGWFQGRSEYGPRALGSRSILANPCDDRMRDTINRYVKYRETFRPFAPSVAVEDAPRFFRDFCETPFMNMVFDVINPELLPAITHVDGTARVQSVANDHSHALYHRLLRDVENVIGVPVVLNTSFNVNGQPIVNTPHEAVYTFFSSGLDVLYVGGFKLTKAKRKKG